MSKRRRKHSSRQPQTAPGGLSGRLVVDGKSGAANISARFARFSRGLIQTDSWGDIAVQAPALIQSHVGAMKRLLAGQDVFDVLELVRQHEIPLALEGYKESESEGLAAVVDIVALVAVGLGYRKVPADHDESGGQIPYANQVVAPICAHARELMRLAILMSYTVQASQSRSTLADLASQLRSSELMIRSKHYTSIAGILNEGVLGRQHIQELLSRTVGFSYDDVVAISSAIRERYDGVKNERFTNLGEWATTYRTAAPPPQVVDAASRTAAELFISPGESSSFTAHEISQISGVVLAQVECALDAFSMSLGGADPEALVTAFVDGRNPLAGIDLIRDGNGNYLMLQNGIPIDQMRRIIESKLKPSGTKAWNTYTRNRDRFAEDLSRQRLSSLLGVEAPTFAGLKYLAPPKGAQDCDLSRSATQPADDAVVAESDALFVIDDLAVCVEVKAGSITDKAKSGNVQRMADDLRKTVGEATSQAQRLESLILSNRGLWRDDGTWLDLEGIREVRSVVVCLDDFGPLAIAADALVRGGLLSGVSIPWIVSVHDLAVIERTLETPASFLVYLRRRTEPQAARSFVAVDELDVFMWFLKGGLYFDPDPDFIHRAYPGSPPPTERDRKRFQRQTRVATRVGTLTDALDAWMYYEDGLSDLAAPRPVRSNSPTIDELVAHMESNRTRGWLRAGADLLSMSRSAQGSLTKSITSIARMTRRDNEWHTCVLSFIDPSGPFSVFLASQPKAYDASDRLKIYMEAKKYQLGSDRALGFLFNDATRIEGVHYLNDRWERDQGLEALVEEMKLTPVASMKNRLTLARKATKKRRKSKKGRRK